MFRVNIFSHAPHPESCAAVALNCPVRQSPAGGVFIGARSFILDKSFIPDRSFIPNQRRYLEYYYRHPSSAAARTARDRIMSAAALEMMLIIYAAIARFRGKSASCAVSLYR